MGKRKKIPRFLPQTPRSSYDLSSSSFLKMNPCTKCNSREVNGEIIHEHVCQYLEELINESDEIQPDVLDTWMEQRQHDNYYAPDTGFNHSEGGNL